MYIYGAADDDGAVVLQHLVQACGQRPQVQSTPGQPVRAARRAAPRHEPLHLAEVVARRYVAIAPYC